MARRQTRGIALLPDQLKRNLLVRAVCAAPPVNHPLARRRFRQQMAAQLLQSLAWRGGGGAGGMVCARALLGPGRQAGGGVVVHAPAPPPSATPRRALIQNTSSKWVKRRSWSASGSRFGRSSWGTASTLFNTSSDGGGSQPPARARASPGGGRTPSAAYHRPLCTTCCHAPQRNQAPRPVPHLLQAAQGWLRCRSRPAA